MSNVDFNTSLPHFEMGYGIFLLFGGISPLERYLFQKDSSVACQLLMVDCFIFSCDLH